MNNPSNSAAFVGSLVSKRAQEFGHLVQEVSDRSAEFLKGVSDFLNGVEHQSQETEYLQGRSFAHQRVAVVENTLHNASVFTR